jgi:pimeloyl-ACP methyl ester carboxylesterase
MQSFFSTMSTMGNPEKPQEAPAQPSVLEAPDPSASARVSLEYIEEDVKTSLDLLVPTTLPSLWSHQWIKSYADDRLIYASIWDARTPSRRRAIVVFSHGFGLHSHVYDNPFLKPLARNDFIAFSYDRRGHGRTGKAGGTFGDIEGDHNARLCDLAAVIDAATHTYPDLPIFLAGHGTGGVEVLSFLSRWSKSSQARLVTGALLFCETPLSICCTIFVYTHTYTMLKSEFATYPPPHLYSPWLR